MLTELHLDHVEAEGLGLPDQVLQRAVGGTLRAGRGEGTLHGLQIGDEVIAGVVHQVGVALDGVVQTVGHDQHDRAVQFLGGDQRGLFGQTLAHFLLMAPQGLQFGACRRGEGLHREVLAHGAGFLLQRGQHVVAELAGHLAAHLGGDVRVAVTVGADPASRVEERRALRRFQTGLVAQQPVVETTVDLRDGVEQRGIEDVENRVGFLDRSRLLQRDRGGAEQCVDLVVQTTAVLFLVGAAELVVHGEQLGDSADLAFHRLAARFGRVRGEDRVELQAVQQLLGLGRTQLVDELVVGDGEFVDRVDSIAVRHFGFACAQRGDAVVFLGKIGEVEVGGECAGQQLCVVLVDFVDDLRGLGQTVLIRIRVAAEVLVACLDRVLTHGVEDVEQLGVVLVEHVTQDLQGKIHVVFQLVRKIVLFRSLSARAGFHNGSIGRHDLLFIFCQNKPP